MEGIWVVEAMADYCFQFAAYRTKAEAEKASKRFAKESGRRTWVVFYKFGEEFDID